MQFISLAFNNFFFLFFSISRKNPFSCYQSEKKINQSIHYQNACFLSILLRLHLSSYHLDIIYINLDNGAKRPKED
uniref:Secreted protein n=1 Tax=Caenorhabditis tropicalis TaxID=1561998 RepID=A0A1I7TM38_9PELO